jgi:serine/threonine protein kinase
LIACCLQILAGLHHVHASGCCHRDVKLENVLFFDDDQLRLVDFGFAADTRSKLTTCCGSWLYVRRHARAPLSTYTLGSSALMLLLRLCWC